VRDTEFVFFFIEGHLQLFFQKIIHRSRDTSENQAYFRKYDGKSNSNQNFQKCTLYVGSSIYNISFKKNILKCKMKDIGLL